MMITIRIFVLCTLVAFGSTAYALDKSISANYGGEVFAPEKVDLVISAFWTNMGNWKAVSHETGEDQNPSFQLSIYFEGPSHEDMGYGGRRQYLANHFMKLINSKEKKNIRLKSIGNDGYVLTLIYADGWVVEWDYRDQLPAVTFKVGTPRKPYPRLPECPIGSNIPRPCIVTPPLYRK